MQMLIKSHSRMDRGNRGWAFILGILETFKTPVPSCLMSVTLWVEFVSARHMWPPPHWHELLSHAPMRRMPLHVWVASIVAQHQPMMPDYAILCRKKLQDSNRTTDLLSSNIITVANSHCDAQEAILGCKCVWLQIWCCNWELFNKQRF